MKMIIAYLHPSALWDFFCSVKLTIVTLILLAATSIIGTLLPQNMDKAAEFKETISESTYRLFEALDFFDMYHSWWFLLLLALFSLNLICCSIKRFPKVWKVATRPVLVPDETFFETLANAEEKTVKKPLAEVREQVVTFLGERFATPIVTEQDGKLYLYAQKAAYARFGVYVTHFSILLIFVGAIIGTLWGYKAYVNIVEGSETTQIWPSDGNKPIDLGFSVRCDKFTVSYYPNSQQPREFRSLLTIIDGGKTAIDKRPVIVNDPLAYKGITFYQSSYGKQGEHEFIISDADGSNPQTLMIQSNGSAKLPDGSGICLQETTKDISQFQQGLSGAAAQVEVHLANGVNKTFVVYSNHVAMNRMNIPYTGGKLLQYKGGEEFMYTGLQVAKDPGVGVVWAGCFLMVAGSMVAFFLSHRRIWMVLTPNGEETVLKFGGNAHRNQPAFEIYFDSFKQDLKERLSK